MLSARSREKQLLLRTNFQLNTTIKNRMESESPPPPTPALPRRLEVHTSAGGLRTLQPPPTHPATARPGAGAGTPPPPPSLRVRERGESCFDISDHNQNQQWRAQRMALNSIARANTLNSSGSEFDCTEFDPVDQPESSTRVRAELGGEQTSSRSRPCIS
jgi:hypothetical protein